MSTSPVSAGSGAQVVKPRPPDTDTTVPRQGASWQKYLTPVFEPPLALALLITLTRN